MSVLDVAARVRKGSRGYTVLSPLDVFPEHVDSDGFTRAWAERETDEALMVVFVKGSHHGIVETHNDRSRIKSERTAAAKVAADKDATDAEREAARAEVETLTADLAKLPGTKAQALLHVARSMRFYETAADAAAEPAEDVAAASPDPGEDVGEDGEES